MIVVWFKTAVAKTKTKQTKAGEKDRFEQGNTTDKVTAIKKIKKCFRLVLFFLLSSDSVAGHTICAIQKFGHPVNKWL